MYSQIFLLHLALLSILAIILWYYFIFWKQSKYKSTTGYSFWTVHLCLFTEVVPHIFKQFFQKSLGTYGEYLIYQELEKIKWYGKIVVNLYLPQWETVTDTEIDLLFIHESWIYCIESKNYSGWIFGNENHTHWTQSFTKKRKYQFYNPIRQNYSHIKSLEKFIPKYNITPIVVFSNGATFKNIECPNNIVINKWALGQEIRKHSSVLLSKENIDELYALLSPYQKHSSEQEYIHNNEVRILQHS